MYFTGAQLKASAQALDEARTTHRCSQPRTDRDGRTSWHRKLPKNGRIVEIPYGEHGAAFLEIDPETLNVQCGACVRGEVTVLTLPADAEERKGA